MEAIIKITPDELTELLLQRVKSFIGSGEGYEIELHVKSVDEAFRKKLDASILEANEGKLIRFTPEELDAYNKSKLG